MACHGSGSTLHMHVQLIFPDQLVPFLLLNRMGQKRLGQSPCYGKVADCKHMMSLDQARWGPIARLMLTFGK